MKHQFARTGHLLASAASAILLFTTRTPAQPPPARPALPLAFEANCGQAELAAEFLARGRDYSLLLSAGGGATLQLSRGAALQLRLGGARADTAGAAEDALFGRVNYFIGNDPAQWRRGIPTFGQVKFDSVYPGVDLIYHGNDGRLEYDFAVAPNADAGQITLKFSGEDSVGLTADGALDLKLAGGSVRWKRPVAGNRRPARGRAVRLRTRNSQAGCLRHYRELPARRLRPRAAAGD